ncbi:hypothetical protein [Cetobacterium sp.]|uniref:hypothetical protein n=1 Tax=Cetobacterium sp. TaxID=2071632 RepID=UPI003EE6F316
MSKSYLTIEEIIEILRFEEADLSEEFNKLDDKTKLYSAQRATFTIEALGIVNRRKKEGELTFPLPYQNGILGEDIKLCVALEALYIALKMESDEIKMAKLGVISKSDKSASVTFDRGLLSRLKTSSFKNLKAYTLVDKYIQKSFCTR